MFSFLKLQTIIRVVQTLVYLPIAEDNNRFCSHAKSKCQDERGKVTKLRKMNKRVSEQRAWKNRTLLLSTVGSAHRYIKRLSGSAY